MKCRTKPETFDWFVLKDSITIVRADGKANVIGHPGDVLLIGEDALLRILERATFASIYQPLKKSGAPPPDKPTVQRAAAPAPDPPQKISITEAVRQAVAEKPRTHQEVLTRVRELVTYRDVDGQSVSSLLCQLRSQNRIYKSDEDLTWRMATPPPDLRDRKGVAHV